MTNDPKLVASLDKFFSQFTKLDFNKGDSLISGNTPSGIYYLTSGHVTQTATTPQGDNILHNIYKPGTFFPMTWGLADIPNRYYFLALGPATAYRAPKEEVRSFLQQTPDVLFDLTRRAFVGLEATVVRLEHINQGSAYQKVVHALVIVANRFSDVDQQSTISLPLTHETMANLAGTTKETYSRTISQLKKKGLIDTTTHLQIPDLPRLAAELE